MRWGKVAGLVTRAGAATAEDLTLNEMMKDMGISRRTA